MLISSKRKRLPAWQQAGIYALFGILYFVVCDLIFIQIYGYHVRWLVDIFIGLIIALSTLIIFSFISHSNNEEEATQSELKHTRFLLQALMDSAPDYIYFKDTEGRFLQINDALAKFLDLPSPEQAIGKTDTEIGQVELVEEYAADEEFVMRTGQNIVNKEELQHLANNNSTWISTTKMPLRDETGAINGTFGISRDITAYKLALEQQRELAAGMKAVLEMADALLNIDDYDLLLRRAVELPRERLGIERCSIYLQVDKHHMIGTFGTNKHGVTTDERDISILIQEHDQICAYLEQTGERWFYERRMLTDTNNGEYTKLFEGELVRTPIMMLGENSGVFFNDNGITGKAISIQKQELLAVYCTLLGNILQRKNAELSLSAERSLLKALMTSAPDNIYFKDRDSRFIRVSNTMKRLFGMEDVEQVIGKKDSDFFSPEHALRALADEKKIITSGITLLNIEEKETWDNAEDTWASTSKMPLYDEAGKIIGTFGISRDITLRKQAEDSLHELAEGLKIVLTMTDDLLTCPDMDSLMRRAVDLPRTMLGLDRAGLFLIINNGEDFAGTYGTNTDGKIIDQHDLISNIGDLYHDAIEKSIHSVQRWAVMDDIEINNYIDHEWIVTGRGWKAVTPIISATGPKGVFLNDNGIHSKEVDQVKQDVLAIYCAALGRIMERMEVEEALRKSEEKARRIADNMLDVIAQLDVDNNISYLSPSIKVVLGYRKDELLGHSVLEIVHPDDTQQVIASFEELKRNKTVRIEERVRHRRGHYLWMETIAKPLRDENGDINGAILSTRDITQRKVIEEELARSNAELQQFAYVASHDLQEPLRMVASYVQLLERRYKGKLDADADEFIGFAVDGATRMKELINDLLTYSRVGSNNKAFVPVELAGVVKRALQQLQLAVDDSGAVIEIDDLPMVDGEESQLVQLFQNLISNALKFRSDKAPLVHVTAEKKGDYWQFGVHDNGIGIDKQYMERIFIMFQRLHSKAQYPGTGIGLAVCKKIIERHGGRIWVEAPITGGSVFYVTLPVPERGEIDEH